MKKYEQPAMIAVNLLHKCQIMVGSDIVYRVSSDSSTGLSFAGEGADANVEARVKDCNLWDEEW